jgi:NarL family two-component system sensor histidine kinase LiaS
MAPFTEVHVLAGLTRHFSTIRWKLTGAFLAVSLLLALTMIATFLGAIFYFLSTPIIPQALADSAREVARGVSRELASPAGEPERLFEILSSFEPTGAPGGPARSPQLGSEGAGQLQGDELLVVLLDTQGRVITSTRPLAYPAGLNLGFVEPAPTYELVVQALAGVTETARLAAWSVPDHQPIAVAPVFDAAGAVTGIVYLRLVNFPPVGLLFANLTPIIVTFILPWLLVSGGLGMLYAWLVGRGFARRIVRLTEASVDLSDGSLSRRIEDPSGDELGQLGRQFNAMADQLSESLRSLRLLADKNAQLAEQAAQLAAVEERNHLARELHDSVSQELFSLTMLAAAARRTLDTKPQLAAERLIEIEESARRALEETRSLIFALRPAALDDRGLAPALRDLMRALEERQGLSVTLRVTGERRLPLEHEQALFRIVQEALANVARHSGVRAAEVELCYGDAMVTLVVRDAGRGFDPAAARNPRAIGLLSMAERAEALGGAFQLLSEPGGGARILVAIPPGEAYRARPADADKAGEQGLDPERLPLPIAERKAP